jgi:hypothetical protein
MPSPHAETEQQLAAVDKGSHLNLQHILFTCVENLGVTLAVGERL